MGFSYLLQTGAEAHVAEVVGEEGARAAGRVAGEQQPAEERHVAAARHAAVQLHRSAQHQQLERLQQPQLLFPALKQPLAELPALRGGGAVHHGSPLEADGRRLSNIVGLLEGFGSSILVGAH